MKITDKYIKSPLNYVGGKYKLLSQILPLFPSNINTFVDLFGGGGNVIVNVKAEHCIYNDILKQVPELLNYLQRNSVEKSVEQIQDLINTYNLSKTNQEGYLKLRNDYNANPTPIKFYTLICYAFNNQIRFNSKGEYNMPFGKNRSSFNPTLLDSWKDKYNIHYLGGDYSNCNYHKKDKSKDIEVLITNY